MVKERKSILEHDRFLSIIQQLMKSPNNSLGLSREGKLKIKDQSTINSHLKYFYEKEFICKSEIDRRKYTLNWFKFSESFLDFIQTTYKEEGRQLDKLPKKMVTNNYLIQFLDNCFQKMNEKNTLRELYNDCLFILEQFNFFNNISKEELHYVRIIDLKDVELREFDEFISFIQQTKFRKLELKKELEKSMCDFIRNKYPLTEEEIKKRIEPYKNAKRK